MVVSQRPAISTAATLCCPQLMSVQLVIAVTEVFFSLLSLCAEVLQMCCSLSQATAPLVVRTTRKMKKPA